MDKVRRAGLPVEVACADRLTPLPAAVDLAAYRVIQEALTNVQKHAGPGAKAEVSVVRVGGTAEVTVLDNGTGRAEDAGTAADGGGHGLLGMRERVTALGGTHRRAPLRRRIQGSCDPAGQGPHGRAGVAGRGGPDGERP